MELPFALDRPVVFFDLETTGLNPYSDRIVELAVVKVDPGGEVLERTRRYNPGIPIPPGATRIHGIADGDVAGEPVFRRTAKSLAALLEPCDLAGFNLRGFDLRVLLEEFKRAGIDFDVRPPRRLIDMKMIYHREEPRTLAAALKFYLGRDHDGAHSALADTLATADVFLAQLERYGHLPRDMEGLHAYCDEMRTFKTAFDRWFAEGSDGLVFNRGKHKGKPLAEVALKERDYLEWMLGADDMPGAVLEAVRAALPPPEAPRSTSAPPEGDRPNAPTRT